MERRLLLDVVVREGAAILELLAGEDEALLVRRNAVTDGISYASAKDIAPASTHPSLS